VLGNVLLEGIINRLPHRVLISTVWLGVGGNQTHVVEGEHLLGTGVNVVGGVNLAKGGDNDLPCAKRKHIKGEYPTSFKVGKKGNKEAMKRKKEGCIPCSSVPACRRE